MKFSLSLRALAKQSITILLFASILFYPILFASVQAASEYDSDDSVAFGVIGTAGTGATYEPEYSLAQAPILGALFRANPNDFGKNLYKTVYKQVKSQGSDIAISRTLARRPLSKEELAILVPGSNIGALLKQSDPKENLSPEEVLKRHSEFVHDLAEEKELADLFVETMLDVKPTELFANGDESDSGFDLLADLDLIDAILFGEEEMVAGGTGPGAPAGSEVAGPRSGGGSEDSGRSDRSGRGDAAGAHVGLVQDSQAAADVAAAEESVVCPLNGSFHNAVAQIRAEEEERGGSGNRDQRGEGGGRREGRDGGGSVEADKEEEEPIVPEESGDFSRPRRCIGPFCLKIEAVYKRESAYLPNANCIACHFEKINDAFKKTLDHNLVPSKATGNSFEAPKCKRSLLGLKFNFILIPQSILTPPNDDLIVKGDFLKNAIDFYERYYDNPGRCDNAAGGACKADPDIESNVTQRVLEQTPEGTPQSTIINQIRQQVANKQAEALEFMKQRRIEVDAFAQANQYKVLMQEIEAFNSHFDGFVQVYNNLVSDKPDFPCKLLLNKKTCSSL